MPQSILPDLAIVLTFLRQGQGWSQTKLAREAGSTPNVINDYERGRKPLSRRRLEQLLAVMAVPPERIDVTLSCLTANRAAARAPADPEDVFAVERRQVEAVSAQAGRLAEELSRGILQLLTVQGEALHGRQVGESLWRRLKQCPAAERRVLIENVEKYQHWALAERVAAESIERAANHPREALELAELAVLIAEHVRGDAAWTSRLAGYAWVHVANAQRVCNDLHAMEAALTRALKLWKEGEPGDPGLLNRAVVPWIEAVCRSEQRRFPEALQRIEDALALDGGELRAKILITKSGILKALGDPKGSTAVLAEAAPLIDGRKDPRLAFYLRFNLLSDLCRLGRADEVEGRLEEVRRLAEQMGEKLDLARIVWVQGLAAAGLGRTAEAKAALGQARRDFESNELAYDYAQVSLDLSLVLLEQGRSGEVRAIAEEMLQIFKRFSIGREAMMALQIFCEAAQRETATVELTRRVVRFLLRAQADPGLRFEEGAEAG